jgi:hypothetical protein
VLLVASSLTAQPQGSEAWIQPPKSILQSARQTFWTILEDGLHLQTPGKEVDLRFGSRLNLDSSVFFPSDALEEVFGDPDDPLFVRRVRIAVQGPVAKFIDIKVEVDFADKEIQLTDVFLRRKQLPYLGDLTIGKFRVAIFDPVRPAARLRRQPLFTGGDCGSPSTQRLPTAAACCTG